jgi:hypothetical protein
MLLIAITSLFLGRPMITFFFLQPSVAGNWVLSRRVQRDLGRVSAKGAEDQQSSDESANAGAFGRANPAPGRQHHE